MSQPTVRLKLGIPLIVPLVKDAIKNNKLVAGICNASVFLGMHGCLNDVNHTSNGVDYLKQFAGSGTTTMMAKVGSAR